MKHSSKVARVRAVGSGPIGPYGIRASEIVPSMHGQQFGRLATIALAVVITISTTGTSSNAQGNLPGQHADAAVAEALRVSAISAQFPESVPTPSAS